MQNARGRGFVALMRILGMFVVAFILSMPCHAADNVLDKIAETGKVTIGHREDAAPFAYYNKDGQWVGFSVDLGQRLAEELGKKLNKSITVVKQPVNSKTRIPLIINGQLDIVIGTTTITLSREDVVDFSLPFFVTGATFIVPKGSGIDDVSGLAGKRVGVAQGTTHIKNIQNAINAGQIDPPCEIVPFEDHAKGFLGLTQKKVDAYFTDASILFGLRAKARNPEAWEIGGRFLSYEPYGFILPQNDSKWRDFVNAFLIHLIKSGEFHALYDKWMGASGEVPMPMSEDYQAYLRTICFPE
ncbi:ABC transporter substrate-binding protein [uncultured Desulfosarcina sp.]|uniref:ABC transporter substrate-binding protein n=1 Tax=uncultured Desulfosarcina sp. TaxID=218289 RepID=UPI0029C811FD|nr:ABC transporter substrate-binding protein [uncultured Desulfosarcina sp.]